MFDVITPKIIMEYGAIILILFLFVILLRYILDQAKNDREHFLSTLENIRQDFHRSLDCHQKTISLLEREIKNAN
jgi:hypothetical protein